LRHPSSVNLLIEAFETLSAISHNAVVVFQLRVVAATESFFSKALFESFVLPYPSGE
jgi:hypothetical protein